MNKKVEYTRLIKEKAKELGFFYTGISKADFLEEEAKKLEDWLKKRHHGQMAYMENHFDKRLDPRLLVDGAKSIISLLLNYFPKEDIEENNDGLKISKYAYGEDYHFVIKKKLKKLLEFINIEIGEVGGRVFVDSAPVMDKVWAKRSGLGWMGKNTNIINPKSGSYFFIAELILDIDLEEDGPIKDYCGSCTRCIDACPTEAIIKPYVVDGSKCISYLTIELKDEVIPKEFSGKMDNWMFGCDVCQQVCPWNRLATPHKESLFDPPADLLSLTKKEWQELDEHMYQKLFKKSALKRTKFQGLKRNIGFLST